LRDAYSGKTAVVANGHVTLNTEFGLVLLSLAGQHDLVPPALFNPILASMVISMLATPFIIQYANDVVTRVVGSDWSCRPSAPGPGSPPTRPRARPTCCGRCSRIPARARALRVNLGLLKTVRRLDSGQAVRVVQA
jgi:hypothetical protein